MTELNLIEEGRMWRQRAIAAERERDALRAALTISRGQWIWSVNAEQCMVALGQEKEWREIQAARATDSAELSGPSGSVEGAKPSSGEPKSDGIGQPRPGSRRTADSAPAAPEPTMVVANYGTEIYRGPPSGWAQFKLEPGVLYNLTAKYVDSTAETADEGLIECRRCGCRQRAAIGSKGWREGPMCHQCAVETGETL